MVLTDVGRRVGLASVVDLQPRESVWSGLLWHHLLYGSYSSDVGRRVLHGNTHGTWTTLLFLAGQKAPSPKSQGQQSLLLANTLQDLPASLGRAKGSYFTDKREMGAHDCRRAHSWLASVDRDTAVFTLCPSHSSQGVPC